MKKEIPWLKIGFIVLIVLIIINLAVLNFWMIEINSSKNKEQLKEKEAFPVSDISVIKDVCPQSCLSEIKEATSSIIIAEPTNVVKKTEINEALSVSYPKESVISFGSGSNKTDDWEDVTGLRTYIDSTKYGRIKSVVFEVTMHIPDGNQIAYARLFNVTDKHPVWFSEVSIEGGGSQFVVSQPVTLDNGNKLYQVQMKTSLKHTAVLDQSRVRITTY